MEDFYLVPQGTVYVNILGNLIEFQGCLWSYHIMHISSVICIKVDIEYTFSVAMVKLNQWLKRFIFISVIVINEGNYSMNTC